MRLLLINFEMDPSSQVLAWQLRVALGLAQECESVTVLTQKSANPPCPAHMRIYLFPPRLIRAPIRWFGGKWLMNIFVWRLCRRHRIDACFIHMNMVWGIYLAPVFRLLGIPVLLWYAHGTVSRKLKLAHRFVTRVVTSTPEGFRLSSKKLSVIGQGVDAELFDIQPMASNAADIITVGRVSARKHLHTMIEVMAALWNLEPAVPFRLVIIGAPLTQADRDYQIALAQRRAQSRRPDHIVFVGQLLAEEIVPYYRSAFVHLNLSQTGSMDKTVMEALAAGCQVLTSNEAFRQLLRGFPAMMLDHNDPQTVARAVLNCYRQRLSVDRPGLRNLVAGKHDLATYGVRVVRELREIQSR